MPAVTRCRWWTFLPQLSLSYRHCRRYFVSKIQAKKKSENKFNVNSGRWNSSAHRQNVKGGWMSFRMLRKKLSATPKNALVLRLFIWSPAILLIKNHRTDETTEIRFLQSDDAHTRPQITGNFTTKPIGFGVFKEIKKKKLKTIKSRMYTAPRWDDRQHIPFV